MEKSKTYYEFSSMTMLNQYYNYLRPKRRAKSEPYADSSRFYCVAPIKYSNQRNDHYHSC